MCELNTVFAALADKRRRLALYYLQKHQTMTLPDLAKLIAEQEFEKDVHVLSGEKVTDLYVSLYHKHIPKLEEADLINYKQEDDLVTCANQISTTLDSAKEEVEKLQTV